MATEYQDGPIDALYEYQGCIFVARGGIDILAVELMFV